MIFSSRVLTVGITTRNRPSELVRTVISLGQLHDLVCEVVVADNGSDVPAEEILRTGLPADFALPLRTIRFETDPGYIYSRNRIVEQATTPYVLHLDDDVQILTAEAVEQALGVMEADSAVGAIAFAQAGPDGSPWGKRAQPSPAEVPSEVASYVGFAHLVRRDAFLRLGGYREFFIYMAEEKEFCLRLLDAGYKVVYLPQALIVHFTSATGRDAQRWLRMNTRNQLLADILNLPWPLALAHGVWHSAQYFRLRRAFQVADPWGFFWVLRETLRELPKAIRLRKPIRYGTYRRWQRLRKTQVPYQPPRARAVLSV